jgi:hypothetical protein
MRILPGSLAVFLFFLLAAAWAPAVAQEPGHVMAPGEKLGTVHFETSCSAAAVPQFDRAMALLHSFEFAQAINGFQEAQRTDPECAMAHWGVALSRWGNPFAVGIRPAAQLRQGLEAVEQARRAGAKTDRERAYLAAVSQLYADFENVDQLTRVRRYEQAMSELASTYPQDREAAIFHALSLTAAAAPTDKTYANQLKAGEILERLFPEQPDHPGIAHYIIHSYDVPPLAAKALNAARSYAKIAPSAPHALHMPSHTFTRVGSWQESIDTNIASAAAARRAGSTAEELHALDYQMYAYLQSAQDQAAQRLLDGLSEVAGRFSPSAIGGAAPGSAGLFALAAIPARWTLERRAWREAAELEPRPSAFHYPEAITLFARALGAARSGDLARARAAIQALQEIKDRLAQANEGYWAEQAEIQRRGAAAWLALAENRPAEALATMRAAAELEDGTEKSAVTPGPIAPARELLGEMLLELNQPAEALQEFQATLKKEPERFRALYGAARAASLSGDSAGARRYYTQLAHICERGDSPGRSELQESRRAVGP